MKRLRATLFPPISVDRRKKTPLYRQLYDWFRAAVLEGRLRAGQQVPSTRSLAAELQISRIPVVNAYEQLRTEGYLETVVGAGTRIAVSLVDDALRSSAAKTQRRTRLPMPGLAPRKMSQRGAELSRLATHPWVPPWVPGFGTFRVNLPAVDSFPRNIWASLVARHSRQLQRATMAYGDVMGHPPLREAIADYLSTVRAVRCDASQIVITTGSQHGLQIAAQVLLDVQDDVGMEDPGYPGAHLAFKTAGANVIPIPVDQEGLNVDQLMHSAPNARAVYITPSHQYPMGMTLSASRRMLLLDWAARSGAWIIEDDYDSEYRFGSYPIGSLQGMDADARVIYIGTFNKVMFPALRLGYVVVPKDLGAAFCGALGAASLFSTPLYQTVLTAFIREGHLARHIRRMRMLYMERRKALINAIQMHLGATLEVIGDDAGMHVAGLLRHGTDDVAVSRRLGDQGIAALPLSICYLTPPPRGGLILGYGGVNVAQIRDGVRKLKLSLLGK
jgi:GntR family transcriptional regulator / MocR family aminotransferase